MREAGILKSLRVNGVPGWAVLFSKFISAFINLLIVSMIILYTAPALFGAGTPINYGAYFITLLLLIFASIVLGMLIGVIAKNTTMATMLSQVIFLPTILLGGLMFPATMLPEQMQWIGRIFPATHAMQAFTGWAFGMSTQIDPWFANIVIIAIGIVGFVISILLFKKTSSAK
jgi:ABC-2 type transport system permease protein